MQQHKIPYTTVQGKADCSEEVSPCTMAEEYLFVQWQSGGGTFILIPGARNITTFSHNGRGYITARDSTWPKLTTARGVSSHNGRGYVSVQQRKTKADRSK